MKNDNIVEQLREVKVETKLTFEELKKVVDRLSQEHKNLSELQTIRADMEDIEKEISSSDSNGEFNILPLSIKDLSETYEILENSANSILDDAEKIMTLTQDSEITNLIMQICQNCNFHDLAGQRIMRVSKNLQKFEKTALTILEFTMGNKVVQAKDYTADNLLNGPALKDSKHASQQDVDKLFT